MHTGVDISFFILRMELYWFVLKVIARDGALKQKENSDDDLSKTQALALTLCESARDVSVIKSVCRSCKTGL